MKLIKFIFICVIFILSAQACLYAEESSGVLVFGPSQQETQETEEYIDIEEDISDAPVSPRIMEDLITGTRVADIAVSNAVTIDVPWQIEYVDSPMNAGFTLVQVDKNNKEIPVYDVDSPVRAMGRAFPAGTYKVYPYKAGGPEMGEISVSIQCALKEQG